MIRPEEIQHPETPEPFKAQDAVWHAGYETGFLRNPQIKGMPTDQLQKASDDGFAAGAKARVKWDKANPEAKEK